LYSCTLHPPFIPSNFPTAVSISQYPAHYTFRAIASYLLCYINNLSLRHAQVVQGILFIDLPVLNDCISESLTWSNFRAKKLIIQYLVQQIAHSVMYTNLSLMFPVHVSISTRPSSGRHIQRHTSTAKYFFFLFCGLCVVIYPYNTNQQDALFALNLFRKLISTCFEQAYCSSS